jgi:hypothetical protein
MIEGAAFTSNDINLDVSIELSQGQMLSGRVRWVDKGKAGIEFSQRVDQTLII